MYPPDGPVTLKTNLSDVPVAQGMKTGSVSSDIVEFDFCGPKVVHQGFKPMVRENAFDAGELAIATFLQAKALGKPFVLLPAPISGQLAHHCMGYNRDMGLMSPKDIEGRRVGVRTYAQTTGLWNRGVLSSEYGVDLSKVTWMTVNEGHLAECSDPPNCERLPKGSDIGEMLLAGELDAVLMGNDMPKDARIERLIPDPHAAAATWAEREGLIPINHIFVVHEDLSRERPDVVRELFRMIVESRAAAPEEVVRKLPKLGYENVHKTLSLAVDWSLEQGLITAPIAVDDLFDDTTRALNV